MFGKVKHHATISGYDPVNKLYYVIYDDNDDDHNTNEYYHIEVWDQQKIALSKKK